MKISESELRKIVEDEIDKVLPGEKYSAAEGVRSSLREIRSYLRSNGEKAEEDLYQYGGYLVSIEEFSMAPDEIEFTLSFLPSDTYDTYQKVESLATVKFTPLDWPKISVQFNQAARGSAVRTPKTEKMEYKGPKQVLDYVVNQLRQMGESVKIKKVREIIRNELKRVFK